MQLFISPTSPFSRLCLALAMLKKQNDLKLRFVNPWENPPELEAINPFSQIPVLLTPSGTAIYNTHMVCQHLDDETYGDQDKALIAYATSLIDVTVQYVKLVRFKAPNTADHPLVARSLEALARALAQAPAFDPDSNRWPEVLVGLALLTNKLRTGENFEKAARPDTKAAVASFAQRDLVKKTTPEALEKKPATVGEL